MGRQDIKKEANKNTKYQYQYQKIPKVILAICTQNFNKKSTPELVGLPHPRIFLQSKYHQYPQVLKSYIPPFTEQPAPYACSSIVVPASLLNRVLSEKLDQDLWTREKPQTQTFKGGENPRDNSTNEEYIPPEGN